MSVDLWRNVDCCVVSRQVAEHAVRAERGFADFAESRASRASCLSGGGGHYQVCATRGLAGESPQKRIVLLPTRASSTGQMLTLIEDLLPHDPSESPPPSFVWQL